MLLGGAAEELCKREEKNPLPFTALKGCASVPFKWEEIPGKPKKTFMNDLIVSSHSSISVAAVPFKWEEKPGKAKPFILEPNPSPSVTTLSQKKPNSTYPDGSRKTSPKTLSERLESISQVRLSRPRKLPLANISFPIQCTYCAQEDQDRGVEESEALNTWRGLKGERELFDEVHCMKAEGITESYSFKGLEWRSSSSGCRSKLSDAAPVLFKNRLQTRMEKYKVVPVENLCKKRDSWDNMVENIKKHHGNGPQEGLTFHFMQPAISPTVQGAGSGMGMVSIGSSLQSCKNSKCSQASWKYLKHASKEPDPFQEKPILDATMEETNPQVFVGKYGGYSKRTRFPTKGQSFCTCKI
ncbi:hypothetical protein SUGI_1203210 [Cryptomeria japonica]|nr:hypothetical protein SUGI_1203210 [Cryptomeria japonica]